MQRRTGTTGLQPSQTTEPASAHNSNTGHEGASERRSQIAADTGDGHTDPEAAAKQRRIAATSEGHLSLRTCPRHGAMMGATSVTRDEIAKTTQEYDPVFVGIDSDDNNYMLYATQPLMRIEMTAAEQSLTGNAFR